MAKFCSPMSLTWYLRSAKSLRKLRRLKKTILYILLWHLRLTDDQGQGQATLKWCQNPLILASALIRTQLMCVGWSRHHGWSLRAHSSSRWWSQSQMNNQDNLCCPSNSASLQQRCWQLRITTLSQYSHKTTRSQGRSNHWPSTLTIIGSRFSRLLSNSMTSQKLEQRGFSKRCSLYLNFD